MLGQGYLVDRQGCIVWDIEPGVVIVHFGSVFLQRENVQHYSERTQQWCGIERHHGVLQILNAKKKTEKKSLQSEDLSIAWLVHC
jgi:hypothetical protein